MNVSPQRTQSHRGKRKKRQDSLRKIYHEGHELPRRTRSTTKGKTTDFYLRDPSCPLWLIFAVSFLARVFVVSFVFLCDSVSSVVSTTQAGVSEGRRRGGTRGAPGA